MTLLGRGLDALDLCEVWSQRLERREGRVAQLLLLLRESVVFECSVLLRLDGESWFEVVFNVLRG